MYWLLVCSDSTRGRVLPTQVGLIRDSGPTRAWAESHIGELKIQTLTPLL